MPAGTVDIRAFIREKTPSRGVEFCLPRFAGSLDTPARLAQPANGTFGYPSWTLAERDARSAFHVMSAVAPVVDDAEINFTEPSELVKHRASKRTAFVFGSRSNDALQWLLKRAKQPNLIDFKFDANWSIVGRDGKKFSIPDPSKLDRQSYMQSTDYGVVARLSIRNWEGSVFLVAGLGGRATEGCGIYLSKSWASLQNQFGPRDFAIVLAFDPPVQPDKFSRVAAYPGTL
jgi:hypothetical protein